MDLKLRSTRISGITCDLDNASQTNPALFIGK